MFYKHVGILHLKKDILTLKKAAVDPPLSAPYLIFVCLAKSSADSMGESMRSTVRKAARLAVYEEIMMRVKNHHMPATIRVETALSIGTGTNQITLRSTQIIRQIEREQRENEKETENYIIGCL